MRGSRETKGVATPVVVPLKNVSIVVPSLEIEMSWGQLPLDLYIEICHHIAFPKVLGGIGVCCRRFNEFLKEPRLYQALAGQLVGSDLRHSTEKHDLSVLVFVAQHKSLTELKKTGFTLRAFNSSICSCQSLSNSNFEHFFHASRKIPAANCAVSLVSQI